MGYEVHITRAEDRVESGTDPITLGDWVAYVKADPEMRLEDFAEATTPAGNTIRIGSPGIAVWVGYSAHDKDENMAWFSWFKDHVSVKNPDEEILGKMCRIAKALNAKVQGDEGELYDSEG